MAVAAVEVERPQRWDEPFGEQPLSDAELERLLSTPPFSRMDEQAFSPAAPLREILRNDTQIVRYAPGGVIYRKGDYGTSACFILSGRVHVITDEPKDAVAEEVQGQVRHERRGFVRALAQLWENSRIPERRVYRTRADEDRVQSEGLFVQDIATVLERHATAVLEAGVWFGELAALGRTPRATTVFAETDVELLEVRWQGLRDLSRRAPELKQDLDDRYRRFGLLTFLQVTPIFQHLTPDQHERVVKETVFESYGAREWTAKFKQKGAAERLRDEPIIVEEGHYPNGLILIRSGFARVSRKFGNGHLTLSYLGSGKMFGFEEIVDNWRNPEPIPHQSSLRAVGYVDVLLVPTRVVEEVVLPTLPDELLPAPVPRDGDTEAPERWDYAKAEIRTEFLEELVEARFINGTATMIIDLERCTRCDDCVRACAATHDGNSRFIRHGEQIGRFMIANACMHCADPVCMIGCPTGAIHRTPGGQVAINDRTCIGCQTCANNCPYDNIRMVEARDQTGAIMMDKETHTAILKATKCDLCVGQHPNVSPACQNACPHDALKRVDMQGVDKRESLLLELMNR